MAGIDLSFLASAAVYTVAAAFVGGACLVLAAAYVPKIVGWFTPRINEEREIVRGNMAVAEYFGRVVQGVLIGISIVIAAAVIAGFRL